MNVMELLSFVAFYLLLLGNRGRNESMNLYLYLFGEFVVQQCCVVSHN